MFIKQVAWEIEGSERLPVRGVTMTPTSELVAEAVIVHGFMGSMERNIIPSIAMQLTLRGFVVHRFDLSHNGIGVDGDTIERLDEFERDSWRRTHEDIRAVVRQIDQARGASQALRRTLIGHSRGGGAVVGYAGRARREGWPEPDAVVSLAGIGWYSIVTDEVRRQLDEQGYYRVRSKRAVGGEVRCGPSWFAEHDEPGDVFAQDVKLVRCPVLLLNGEADVSVPLGHAERVKTLLEEGDCPRVELVTIPGADHNFNSIGVGLERENARSPEALRVADEIARFFDEVNPYRGKPTS